jgi:hypothetical protein
MRYMTGIKPGINITGMSDVASTSTPGPLTRAHRKRLRDVYRSSGWPVQDNLEVELLAEGLLVRERDSAGRDLLRVTDAGIAVLAQTAEHNHAAFSAHEWLVQHMARDMLRAGRVVWCGLALRAAAGVDEASHKTVWRMAMPDVFSIRNTTQADHVEPIVHEVKVRRADLLSDLRHDEKRAAYLALAGECYYVLAEGVGSPADIPPEFGVIEQQGSVLQCLRPAPRRAMTLPFAVWMALAKATPLKGLDEESQGLL